MDSQKIGQRIASLRKEQNLTQQELADRLGVTNKAVSKWERGDGLPDISLMTALADALDVTVDELLRGERRAAPLPDGHSETEGEADALVPLVPPGSASGGDTRVFDVPPALEDTYLDSEEEAAADEPLEFYRRPWFLPMCIGAAVVVLLIVLVAIFWMGKRATDGEKGGDFSSSFSPSYGTTLPSAETSASTVSTMETAVKTTTTASKAPATTTTTTMASTSKQTSPPTVPTSPPAPTNPALPGTGVIPQAKHAILFNATQGKVVYGYGYDERCYPASLTKLLTAIVAVENCDEDAVFTVGDELLLVEEDSSIAYLEKGQSMNRDVLIHAMLLESGNDASYVLAAGIGRQQAGDPSLSAKEAVEVFCTLMNQKAKALGAVSSHFVNPDGFHNSNHYTTPMDILTIARYAYRLPEIKNVIGKEHIRDVFESGEDVTWKNSNRLVRTGDTCFYEGATGMKTGFTDQAGDCLVATAEKNGVTMFAVVMDAPSDQARYEDAAALLDAGFSS